MMDMSSLKTNGYVKRGKIFDAEKGWSNEEEGENNLRKHNYTSGTKLWVAGTS